MTSRNDARTDRFGRTITYSEYGTPIVSDYPDGTCGVCDGNSWIPTRNGGINCPRCNYPELRNPIKRPFVAYADR